MKFPHLVYLHGMNSSPHSKKAKNVALYAKKHHPNVQCEIPCQSVWPTENARLLLNIFRKDKGDQLVYIIGSSLGGYFGTWLREKIFTVHPGSIVKMVLINPVARPYLLFHRYLGIQTNQYTGQKYTLTMEHVNQIKSLEVSKITEMKDILLLLQTGDEILDYRQSLAKYQGCNIQITQGGSHAFERFSDYLPRIFSFLES